MDVSDIKLLQTIYYILSGSVSIRSAMSLYEFRMFLLTELRKQGFQIDVLNDEYPLYSVDEQVILYFLERSMDERGIMVLLMRIVMPYSDNYMIAYAIQNRQGACVFRFEMHEGFVSYHEKGN